MKLSQRELVLSDDTPWPVRRTTLCAPWCEVDETPRRDQAPRVADGQDGGCWCAVSTRSRVATAGLSSSKAWSRGAYMFSASETCSGNRAPAGGFADGCRGRG